MNELLSLTRAARLIGVSRTELQRKIQRGEMVSHDGMVNIENLLMCYPDAQLEDTVEFRRVTQIKERAFGKRVVEYVLPDAEVLAARLTDLGTKLANSQSQVNQFNALLRRLWDKLTEIESQPNRESRQTMENLKKWIKNEVELSMEPEFIHSLAIKDSVLRIMTAQVTVLPSKHDFLLEGHDTILEAAMRSGIPLDYGCSGGNCGLCKAKVLSGEVRKTRQHDFVISEAEKNKDIFSFAATPQSVIWFLQHPWRAVCGTSLFRRSVPRLNPWYKSRTTNSCCISKPRVRNVYDFWRGSV